MTSPMWTVQASQGIIKSELHQPGLQESRPTPTPPVTPSPAAPPSHQGARHLREMGSGPRAHVASSSQPSRFERFRCGSSSQGGKACMTLTCILCSYFPEQSQRPMHSMLNKQPVRFEQGKALSRRTRSCMQLQGVRLSDRSPLQAASAEQMMVKLVLSSLCARRHASFMLQVS